MQNCVIYGSNSVILEADYMGSHGYNLYVQTNVNRYAGDLVQHGGTLTRLNPNFGAITYGRHNGYSDAHYGTFLVSKRFSRGFSAKGIYTFDKGTDLMSSNDNGAAGAQNILDAANPELQHAVSDFNVSQRLTIDSVYNIPSLVKTGIGNKILGGWELAGIAIFQTGLPFSVVSTAAYPRGDYNADGFNYDYPNTPSFGNSVSVSRSAYVTGFKEAAAFQLRGEVFNLFNRVNLLSPVNDLSNALFGKSTGQSLPRAVTFGARIQF